MTLATGTAHKELKASQEEGFTLIEFLVTILIVGILSSIAIPSFLNARKAEVDGGVESSISAVAAKAVTAAAGNFRNLDMEDVKNTKSTLLTPGTIIGMKSSDAGYCLTAYHPDSHYTATKPLIFDSGLNIYIHEQEKLQANGACSPSVWGQPINPAYKVTDAGKLEAVVPLRELPNACQGVRPYKHWDTFNVTVRGGEYVQIKGSLELTANCEELKYDFQVQDADENKTYIVDLMTYNRVPGGLSTGVSKAITIPGTARTEGTILTNWTGRTNISELVVGENIHLLGHDYLPLSWKLASAYQPTN